MEGGYPVDERKVPWRSKGGTLTMKGGCPEYGRVYPDDERGQLKGGTLAMKGGYPGNERGALAMKGGYPVDDSEVPC